MLPRLTRRSLLTAGLAAGTLAFLPRGAAAQTDAAPLTDGPELYPGERALAEAAAKEGVVISANTALGWANWGAVVRAFGQRYPDVPLVYSDLGSTATVTQLDRLRERPPADTAYFYSLVALDAASRGLLAPHRPVNLDRLPGAAKDAEGLWVGVHTLPIAFVVNRKLVKTLPRTWADLRKPEFKGAITYPDPQTTTVGLTLAFAANIAAGGSLDSVRPGLEYFTALHKTGNVQRIDPGSAQTRFLRGEIPVWITFEADGLRVKHLDGMDEAEIILPADGTASAAYTLSLVKNARNAPGGKLWMNFALTETAQRLFAEGFVRPILPNLTLPPDLAPRFAPLPPRSDIVDSLRATLRKADIDRAWPKL
ncbi:extracellular solute-binding protein [Elstera cyanobacteriorum]|uniref:extracellular solute-binding protein n=1 Tax=Elstera cyanobacteriorum TaxID=2022747 RepID=UPI00235480CC|nr:extracellular solute-binding protein [Elstera cyanobacteriorum]MCK6444518.1 extracellular solute-binding protein [Elstera cyanobacteriorum]